MNHSDFFVSHRLPLGVAARARGWDVHVATGPGKRREQIEAAGLTHHLLPLERSSARPLQELETLAAMKRLYSRLRPDIVHHVTIKPVLYGGLVSRWLNVPGVVHAISGLGYIFLARGAEARARRAAVKLAYRAALRQTNGRVIFQNTADRDSFVDAGLVRGSDSVLIPGSGVDLVEFAPVPPPASKRLTIVLPARMLRDKGVVEFVQAARMLRERGLDLAFKLAGGTDAGNPAAVAQNELAEWHREGIVEWLGHVDDMAGLLRGAHIVCLPSYREGLSKALIEAAAAGRPIVTTDTPGCRDVVRDGENGLVVPVRNAGALADAIATLAGSEALREEMGARGRQRAVAEFSVESTVEKTFEVYEELLARSRVGI